MSLPESNPAVELKDWAELQRSGSLKVLFNVFDKHHCYCVQEAMSCVRKGDFHNAVRYEAKAEDTNKIIGLIRARISGLKKEEEERKGRENG